MFGCHAKSISRDRQPPAHHQVLLRAHFSPVWGRYSHRTELLHTGLLPPHAQPLHHPSTRLWGTVNEMISMSLSCNSIWLIVWLFLCSLNFLQNVLIIFEQFSSDCTVLPFRFPVRRTPFTCTSCLPSKIPVWEHWSPTLLPQSSMLSLLYRYSMSWLGDGCMSC